MLVECCKFGKVLRLVSPEGVLFDHLGCIAVTFESMAAARDCASSLHGRWFDSRQIETLVFSPPSLTLNSVPSSSTPFTSSSSLLKDHISSDNYGSGSDIGSSNLILHINHNSDNNNNNNNSVGRTTDNCGINRNVDPGISEDLNRNLPPEEIIDESPDVDDFLNSFL